jgi:hypothetical protein
VSAFVQVFISAHVSLWLGNVRTYVCACVCKDVCVYTSVRAFVHVCVFVCVCVSTCVSAHHIELLPHCPPVSEG